MSVGISKKKDPCPGLTVCPPTYIEDCGHFGLVWHLIGFVWEFEISSDLQEFQEFPDL